MITRIATQLGRARKTIAALVTGVIGWGYTVVSSEPTGVTAAEWMMLSVVVATAFGVYAVANDTRSGGTTVAGQTFQGRNAGPELLAVGINQRTREAVATYIDDLTKAAAAIDDATPPPETPSHGEP